MADQCDPELGANTDPELGANTDPELGANTDPELGANTDPELGANTDPGEPMEEGPGLTVQLGGTYLCQKPDGTYQDVEVVEMRSNEQAQSEEYMVCYTGMPCRQTEWVDKTRLVLRKLPRDEYSEEGNVRGMLESGQRPDADEPKTKKAKVEDRGAASGSSLSRASASDTPLLRGKDAPSKHCAIHNMQIKLYCKDDGVLCCVICRDSLKHLNHKFLTIQDAVVACRADLSDTINSMEETLNELKELGGPPTDNAEQRKIDVPECKQNIVSGFEKLYASLEEQKRKMLERLKQQGQGILDEMVTNVAWLNSSRIDLQDSLEVASEKIEDTNPYSFVTGVKSFLDRVQEKRQAVLSFQSCNEKKLCQGTFKGPLQYIIWRQMKSVVDPNPEPDEPIKTTPVDPPAEEESVKEVDKQPEPEETEEEPEDIGEEAVEPGDATSARMHLPPEDLSDLANKGFKEIWIVGEGILNAARHVAGLDTHPKNLGIPESVCRVNWIQRQHKQWSGLLTKLRNRTEIHPKPDILFIYMGGFELMNKDAKATKDGVATALCDLVKCFPRTSFVLSTLLPRKDWLGTALEQRRKVFNTELCRIAQKHRFQIVKHERLESMLLDRFPKDDKVHLNENELNMFVENLRDAFIKELRGYRNAPGKTLEQQKAPKPSPIAGKKESATKVKSVTPKESDQQPEPEDPEEMGEAAAEAPEAPPAPPPEDFSDLMNKGQKEAWVLGDGILISANRVADKGPYAKNLGIPESVCHVNWINKQHKIWSGLLAKLQRRAETQRKPDIMFVHIGNYDMMHKDTETMITSAFTALYDVIEAFPGISIILSTLLPKKDWLGTVLEPARKAFNTALCRFAGKHHLQILKHKELESLLLERFEKEEYIRLGDAELEMFIETLRNALIKELRVTRKAPEKGLEKLRPLLTSPIAGTMVETVRMPDNPQGNSGPMSSEPKFLWIIGNQYIYKAYGHAGKCSYGTHLGFKDLNWNIRWLGRATRWHRLVPELLKSVDARGTASAIFIHIGTEDLENISFDCLLNDAGICLGRLSQLFPSAKLILSTVLPRAEWLGSHLEESRKMFNMRLYNYAASHNLQVATHNKLEQQLLLRFLQGGSRDSSLMVSENDQFIDDIRQFLLKAMFPGYMTATEISQLQEKILASSRVTPAEVRREGTSTNQIEPSTSKQTEPSTAAEREEKDKSVAYERLPQRTMTIPPAAEREEKDKSVAYERLPQRTMTIPPAAESEERDNPVVCQRLPRSFTIRPGNKLILILGNNYIIKAIEHATKASYLDLGFTENNWSVRWNGGFDKWIGANASVRGYKQASVPPSVIFFHVGVRDINATRSASKTLAEVRKGVKRFIQQFPKARIILTALLPKVEWRKNGLENVRKQFNEEIPELANKLGLEFVGFEELQEKINARLDTGDPRSKLTDSENEIFIKLIRESVQQAMLKGEKVPVPKALPQEVVSEVVSEPEDVELSVTDERMEIEEDLGDPSNLPEHNILIIGDAQIRAIQMYALNSPWGQNLGLEKRNWTLHWLCQTMRWSEFQTKVQTACHVLGTPSAIFIHLGGNDLGHCRNKKLIGDVRSCLGQLAAVLPNTQMVFSPILSRVEWMNKPLDDCRKKFNESIASFVKKCGYETAIHDKLDKMRMARFKRGDQTWGLSDVEKERFVRDLRESLLTAMLKDPGTGPQTQLAQSRLREPQEEALSSGATLYLIPDTERRSFIELPKISRKRKRTEGYRKKCLQDIKRYSSYREEEDDDSDDDDYDRRYHGSSSDEEVSDAERRTYDSDGKDSDHEEADRDTQMECDPPATLPENTAAPADAPGQKKSGTKQIWILGGSFFCRAKQHAESKPYWHNLGLDEEKWTVRWMGTIGMRWESLARDVDEAMLMFGTPSVLIIHLGGNDLGRMPYKNFLKAVKFDFRRFAQQLRETQVIFSTVLPRAEWLMTPVEEVRIKFNKSMVASSWNLCYHVLAHSNIEENMKARFLSGRGSDLSEMEYHLLLTSIKDCVFKVVKD